MKSRIGNLFLDLLVILFTAFLLCLPDYSGKLWPVTFIALIPLLLRIRNRRFAAKFFITFLTYTIYLTYSISWMKLYGWHWTIIENAMNAVTYGVAFAMFFFVRDRIGRNPAFIFLPIIYMVTEYGKSLGTFSFPWPLLSHTQYQNLPFIQISEITGAWGVTFLLVWVNAAIFGILVSKRKSMAVLSTLPVTLAVVATITFGLNSLGQPQPEPTKRVSLFQRDWNTQHIYSLETNEQAWNDYSSLTLNEWQNVLNKEREGFIVWPEGAIVDALDRFPLNGIDSRSRRQLVESLVRMTGKTFIIGTQGEDENGLYNTAAIFNPDGSLAGKYSKVHIVPFGEVIPLEDWIKSYFPQYPWGDESLKDGRELKSFETEDGHIGVVICYESFFSDLVRRIVLDDCEYLFLITNTSWFGKSKASLQHAHYDVFRSIENRIWLSRAATTGVSSFIDPYGRRFDETALYEKKGISRKVYPRLKTTVYTKWGDWLPKTCLILLLIIATFALHAKSDRSGQKGENYETQ